MVTTSTKKPDLCGMTISLNTHQTFCRARPPPRRNEADARRPAESPHPMHRNSLCPTPSAGRHHPHNLQVPTQLQSTSRWWRRMMTRTMRPSFLPLSGSRHGESTPNRSHLARIRASLPTVRAIRMRACSFTSPGWLLILQKLSRILSPRLGARMTPKMVLAGCTSERLHRSRRHSQVLEEHCWIRRCLTCNRAKPRRNDSLMMTATPTPAPSPLHLLHPTQILIRRVCRGSKGSQGRDPGLFPDQVLGQGTWLTWL